MNALSWAAAWISLPARRDATTLLVPTSSPIGWVPDLTRSSICSVASSSTFQSWSLFSAMSFILRLQGSRGHATSRH